MHNFKELLVWQKSRILFKEVYELTCALPKEELYGLTSQIRRSAQSIPSNIAEGCGRNTDKDLCRFLDIAYGSAFELETQLILCSDIELISEEKVTTVEEKVREIQKMLFSFRNSKQS